MSDYFEMKTTETFDLLMEAKEQLGGGPVGAYNAVFGVKSKLGELMGPVIGGEVDKRLETIMKQQKQVQMANDAVMYKCKNAEVRIA